MIFERNQLSSTDGVSYFEITFWSGMEIILQNRNEPSPRPVAAVNGFQFTTKGCYKVSV